MASPGPPCSPSRWQQIQEHFQRAAKLPPQEVDPFLEELRATDGDLASEVGSLLTAHAEAGDFLQEAVGSEVRSFLEERDRGRIGTRVGPYRLVRPLGSGGMSTVFLAVRADETFDKEVAVKVIKRGMDTEEVLLRFDRERRILARLEHPNLARLLDAVTTEDGLPAFVMEWVDGEPLEEYCDHRRLDLRSRIELFRSVCGAVHYAHQNLVVHRDLKPSNILVTAEGVPKLLDFGIARLLASEPFGLATATAVPFRAMTPAYACPEQVRGEAVTTAGDVYSLGVLLYQLLTGRNPHRFAHLGAAEVERVVCEQEIQKPSSAVTEDASGRAPGVLGAEGGAQRLRRELAGDLDKILLMALKKDPSRRYGSVRELSEDLHRFLRGLPVAAQKDTAGYRASKFIRRHRVGVAAAAAILATLTASAVFSAQQARQATAARARAEQELERAEQVSALLDSFFELSDPSVGGSAGSSGALLAQRAANIRRELADQPRTQAKLMATIGRIYSRLGHYQEAEDLLQEVVSNQRSAGHPRKLAESLNLLGLVHYYRGAYHEAEARFREALELELETSAPQAGERPEGGREGPSVLSLRVESLNGLALVLHEKGEMDEAAGLYQQALDAARTSRETEPLDLATTLNGLALLLNSKGEFEAAEEHLRRALAIRRRHQGEEHQDIAQALHNLAAVLYGQGDLGAAEPVLQEALAMRRSLLGEEHPEVARTLNTLASLHFARGDLERAERLYREILERRRRLLGSEHPEVAQVLNNLARVLSSQDRPGDAEILYRQALAMKERLYGADHPRFGVTFQGLAEVLHRQGAEVEAERYYRQALARYREDLIEGHPRIGETLLGLGALLARQGRGRAAAPLLREAAEILDEAGHDRLAEAEAVLAEVTARARPAQARTAGEAAPGSP